MVTNTKTDNVKIESNSIFGTDRVGDVGKIIDGTYNVPWVIYNITGSTYQLFPMKNLGNHQMNPTNTNTGGYEGSEMYTYIHNTVLPNLKRSGLNITSCDLVSYDAYDDIVSKTGMRSIDFAGGEGFWLADPNPDYSGNFYIVYSNGSTNGSGACNSRGVRPLITVIK